MDNAVYPILALALAGLIYVSVKTVLIVRHAGFLRLGKALGAYVVAIACACTRLFGTRAVGAPQRALEVPEDGHDWNRTWDKVGAVAAPEQYLHHPDQEVSGLARAHFDDD
jgi:hypothetical protein